MQTKISADEYRKGLSSIEIAKKYGVSKTTVLRHLRKEGIKRRSLPEACIKNTLDTGFFQSIDSDEKAYWLGFLLADGNIQACGRYKKSRSLRIALQNRDESHLVKLRKALGSSHKIKDNPKTKSSWLCITSIGLVTPLIESGWYEFKRNGDVRIMEMVPMFLRQSLLRGLIDGDGWITMKKDRNNDSKWVIGFTDLFKTVVIWVKREIERTGIESLAQIYKPKNHKNWSIAYTGNIAKKVIRSLYTNDTVFLDRKQKLAMEALHGTAPLLSL